MPRGACPEGASTRVPAHAKDNTALQAAVSAAGEDAAFLPVQGGPPTLLLKGSPKP